MRGLAGWKAPMCLKLEFITKLIHTCWKRLSKTSQRVFKTVYIADSNGALRGTMQVYVKAPNVQSPSPPTQILKYLPPDYEFSRHNIFSNSEKRMTKRTAPF